MDANGDELDQLNEVILDPNQQVWHLRMAGFSFDEISERMVMAKAEAIKRYRQYVVEVAQEWGLDDREQIKSLNYMRLEMMMRGHLTAAVAGDKDSTDRVLKIVDIENKMAQIYSVDPSTEVGQAQIFVVQGDKDAYVEALRKGRELPASGPDPDDGGDEEDG